MAQAERRAKAVLAAATAWVEFLEAQKIKPEEMTDGPARELALAVRKYGEAAKALAALSEDPTTFVCPHCGEVKPNYGWNYNAGDTGPFAVAYLTVFCGTCKAILSVCVTTFMPSDEIAKALMDQFKGRLGKKLLV